MTDPDQLKRINLLAKKWQRGTITSSEREEFERWYALFDDVLEVNTDETRENAENRIYATILSRADIRVGRSPIWPRLIAAASILLSISIGGYFFLNKKGNDKINTQTSQTVYLAPAGKKKSFRLIDGTLVRLNSASKLTILPGYNVNKREVLLEGEGYFTVVHNAKTPFSVHTTKFDVNDLGTVFNIKAYTGDKTSEAILLKGSIEVVLKNSTRSSVLLSPNKKLIISNSTASFNLSVKNNQPVPHYKVTGITNNIFTNSIIETDWTNNKLSFYDLPFEDMVPMIERWYGLKLTVKDKQLLKYRFTATFDKQPVDSALKILAMTQKFNHRKEGNAIIIY